jgi:hypothetical protein
MQNFTFEIKENIFSVVGDVHRINTEANIFEKAFISYYTLVLMPFLPPNI